MGLEHFNQTRTGRRRAAAKLIATIAAAALLTGCGTPADSNTPAANPTATKQLDVAIQPEPTTQVALPTLTPTMIPAPTSPTTTTSSATSPAPATTEPPRVFNPEETPLRLETVAEGLEIPVFLTHAGDGSGRLFVIEKVGRIRIIENGEVKETPFLDITDRVGSSANEQGLLGLAFAPDYSTSGMFYVNYTDRAGDTAISRFNVTDDPNMADPASETFTITFDQPAANHNGGMITFGPDGMLWIGTGDGGGAGDRFGNGQNPQSLLGKMLRIDVTSDPAKPYNIPRDNPWVSENWNGQDVYDEIWAIGMRNPWRFSFDRATGDLWIGDVGQNTYEEIDLVPAGSTGGLNFGWPIMEGLHCFQEANCDTSGLVLPIIEYDHSGNCSVTGGYVYRGASAALQGIYFYADYCSMRIWAATPTAGGAWNSVQILQADSPITSWGEDEQGELYVVESGGRVSRLVEATP